MTDKEAKSRIKINKLLEESCLILLNIDGNLYNILLENKAKLTAKQNLKKSVL